jgi:hypothetical protein
MDGLRFDTAMPPVRSDPARADIACFVGFTPARVAAAAQRGRLERVLRELGWAHADSDEHLPAVTRVLPPNVVPFGTSSRSFPQWLEDLGWTPATSAVRGTDLFRRAAGRLLSEAVADWWAEHDWLSPFAGRSAADLLELVDVPVPVDAWDVFDALFAWDRRVAADGARVYDTTLGAAVRRFFLQGGRKCYVVRLDDPWPPSARMTAREPHRARILSTVVEPTPVDRATWRGVAHLFGLPDVSFLCTPDLPELFVDDRPPFPPEPPAVAVEERFVDCAASAAPPPAALHRDPLEAAPRSSDRGFEEWSRLVRRIGSLLQRHRRDVQFIAAVPLPPLPRAVRAGGSTDRVEQWRHVGSIQTVFVQLAYPWLRTRESARLPGSIEPPDATLAGMLASSALTNGTWRSVARQPVPGLIGLEPNLAMSDLERPVEYAGASAALRTPRRLRDRVSVFAPSPTAFQLLSDVTTDDDEAYRPANVNRLVASLIRAARVIGESTVFMNNGEAVWAKLRSALEEVLLQLWGEGALAGASSADAFEVRCDRSTMTQTDLDAGRAIAKVQFVAASPIEQITVIFAVDEGGQVSLVTSAVPDAAEAPV